MPGTPKRSAPTPSWRCRRRCIPSTIADLKAHYRAIGAATALPLVLQNVIGQGATTMSAPLIAELVNEIPTARFVKEESGYPAQTVGEIIRLCGDKVEGVMGGRAGKTLLEEVRHGVSGTMPACEIADVHVALWNAIEAKDDKRVRGIFQRLLPLLDMESNYGMPLMKEVLKMRGVIGSAAVPPVRLPHARRPCARRGRRPSWTS